MENTELPFESDNKPKKRPIFSSAFFAGPVSLDWLQKACRLGGKALGVGVALLHEAKLKKRSEVRMTGSLLAGFGITRYAGNRALKKLKAAGLLEFTESGSGKCKVVRLIGYVPES
jgi:hypothetical protein